MGIHLKSPIVPDILSSEDRFQVFAVEVMEDSRIGKRGLKGHTVYYLYQGYSIENNGQTVRVQSSIEDNSNVFNDYLLEASRKSTAAKTVPHISISAIVGKNGSGKSTIIEFMLRLVNNFSAILFGEQLAGDSSSHLHYIDHLHGALYFFLDEEPHRLEVNEREVSLNRYGFNDEKSTRQYKLFERVEDKKLSPISENGAPIMEKIGQDSVIHPYIQHFFYTIVSNYSIYAYNTLDYADENNSEAYERKIRQNGEKLEDSKVKIEPSDRNWLQGIFHKNDGYKTPLVLTPFRDKGNININVENTLSRERFISMLLLSYDEQGGFKRINGHLDVEHFKVASKGSYGLKYINTHLDIDTITEEKYADIYYQILARWSDLLFRNETHLSDYTDEKIFGDIAINYIVYKTIKITTKYADYASVREVLEDYQSGKIELDSLIEDLDSYITDLRDDRSHITRKIRQAIAYLLTPSADDVYTSDRMELEVKDVSRHAKSALADIVGTYGYDFYIRDIEDMIPPAFLNTEIILKETSGKDDSIAFETLSSGEKQQIFSVCGLLYHLLNINSVQDDTAHNRFSYSYVNLLLEEIELYFHPDFQRQYITMILDGIAQLNLSNIKGINLCFVTHSPFILSDIPQSNLLILEHGEAMTNEKNEFLKTFGANIYDMLRHSFFLEGTPIGSYAQWLITRIIVALSVHKYVSHASAAPSFDDVLSAVTSPALETANYSFLESYRQCNGKFNSEDFASDYGAISLKQNICMVDEPFVRENLLREYYKVFPSEYNRQQRIAELESELERLYLNEE